MSGRRIGWQSVVRLVTYYAVAALAVWAMDLLGSRGDPGIVADGMAALRGEPPPEATAGTEMVPRWVEVSGQMLGALILALPLAYVYVRTRTRAKYDRSLIPTVVILPVVTTAIVSVVRSSLALAFSLAGIVAAVRFRNDLKESNDAVYIFGAVGIGFAAGIDSLPIAAVLSAAIAILELALFRLEIGGEFEQTFARVCPASEAPAEPALRSPATPASANGARPAVRLRVQVGDSVAGRRRIEARLEADTKRWESAAVEEVNGKTIVEYVVSLRKRVPLADLDRALREAGATSVELVGEQLASRPG